MYILKKDRISKENIECVLMWYTAIKYVIVGFLIVTGIFLVLVTFFWSDNYFLDIIAYAFFIVAIAVAYMFPIGKTKLEIVTLDDYKEVLRFIAGLDKKIKTQMYLSSIHVIKRSIDDFEHDYFRRLYDEPIDHEEQANRNNISKFQEKMSEKKDSTGISVNFYSISYARQVATGLLNVFEGKEKIENIDNYIADRMDKGTCLLDPATIGNLFLLAIIVYKFFVTLWKSDLLIVPGFNLLYNVGADIIAFVLAIIVWANRDK